MVPLRQPQGEVPIDTQMKRGFNRDKAILALQRAMKATFDDGRWQELGYLVGKHDVVVGMGGCCAASIGVMTITAGVSSTCCRSCSALISRT